MIPPAISPEFSAEAVLKINIRSIVLEGIKSKLNERTSISVLGVRASFSNTVLYRSFKPRTITNRLSTMFTPGTRRTTCAASRSWVLAICCADIPTIIWSAFLLSIKMAFSVWVLLVAFTTISSIILLSSSKRMGWTCVVLPFSTITFIFCVAYEIYEIDNW